MSRRCERPDCAAAATIAYGFDASARTAWFADLHTGSHGGRSSTATAGALCRRHAAAMVLPRGWWLDDRRAEAEALLFAPSDLDQSGDTPDITARGTRTRRARSSLSGDALTQPALGFDEPIAAVDAERATQDDGDGGTDAAPVAEPVADPTFEPVLNQMSEPVADPTFEPVPNQMSEPMSEPAPWMPAFDHTDDLDGLLDARSPLLARAFQGRRRSTGPAR